MREERGTLWHFVMSIVKYSESHYVTVLDMYVNAIPSFQEATDPLLLPTYSLMQWFHKALLFSHSFLLAIAGHFLCLYSWWPSWASSAASFPHNEIGESEGRY